MTNFYSPVRGTNETTSWRWLAVIYVVAMWLLVGGLLTALAYAIWPKGSGVPEWAQMLTSLIAFVPFFIAAITVPRLFGRSITSGLTSAPHFRWAKYAFGVCTWGGLLAISALLSAWAVPDQLSFRYEPTEFWSTLVVGVLLLPLQTGAEEILFRGVLAQSLSGFLRKPAVVIVVTSAIFAALHLGNPEAESNRFFAFLTYFIMAAGFSYAAFRTGGLEIAIGAHFINNFSGLFIVGYDNSVIHGTALWSLPLADLGSSVVDTAIMVMVWILLIRKFTRD